MKQFLDFVPLILFLIVYKMEERVVNVLGYDYTLGGVFSATEILVVATVIVFGGAYLKNRKLTNTQMITLVAVVIFCTFTIVFRSESILKWKAPVVNWIFAGIFLVSHYVGRKTAIEHMLGHALKLPQVVWRKLNMAWAGCFLFLGIANLFVAFTFHEIWVDFKVFGSLGILLLFNILQIFYIAPYIKDDDEEQQNKEADGTMAKQEPAE